MVNLLFHDIFTQSPTEAGFSSETSLPYKVSVEVFEDIVRSIRQECDERGVSSDSIRFTFDDGGCNSVMAASVLEKYGFRGLFFISTGLIGVPGFVTEEDIRTLSERGHSIGSHMHSHTPEVKNLCMDELLDEWMSSVRVLRVITGKSVDSGALPYGIDTPEIVSAAVQSGISTVFTCKPTVKSCTRGGAVVPGRFCVHSSDSADFVKRIVFHPALRFFLLVRWYILNAFKSVLGHYYPIIKTKFFS